MKKTFIKMGVIILTLLATLQVAHSQFLDAFVTETAVGASSITADNTGNDILDYNSHSYEVSVWDDNSNTTAGFYWNYDNGTYSGYNTLSSSPNVLDPDVCLLNDGNGNVFAVVAYFDPSSNDYYWEYFAWTGTAFSSGVPNSFSTAFFGTSVNIDANLLGDFAIAWDNASGTTYTVTGSTAAFSSPALNYSGVPLQISGTGTGYSPDVALSANDVHYVYIDAGNIIADIFRFSALASGTGGPNISVYYTSSTGGPYSWPRVACPQVGAGDDFTFVAEEINTSIYNIAGFNSYSGSVSGPIYYTDGNNYNMTAINYNSTCLRPVVTYSTYDNKPIWIGWVWDNRPGNFTGSPPYDAQYPLVIPCTWYAIPISTYEYWTVPLSSAIASQDVDIAFSIAGRNSINNLYTFYKSAGSDIYTKAIVQSASTLRNSHKVTHDQENISTWLSDFISTNKIDYSRENINFRLFDNTGRNVYEHDAIGNIGLSSLISFFKNLPSGIFFIHINSTDDKFSYKGKILIIN